MKIDEIETRINEIETELRKEDCDKVDDLKDEFDKLVEERKKLEADVETRKQLLDDIAKGKTEVREVEKPKEEKKMDIVDFKDKPEYRTAWLKSLLRQPLTAIEQRELVVADVAGAIPTQTVNEIIRKLKEMVPLLNEITLLQVAGNVSYAVEGTIAAASQHTENGLITSSEDTLVTVSLAGFEVVKLIRISKTVATMSINAFEGWLIDQIAEAVGYKIEGWIVNGSGSSEPKGVDYANTWTDGTNAVDYAGAKPTYAEVVELIGYLKGGYARNAKFLVNHKTFWQDIQALRDDNKYPLVSQENNGYRIMGFPVIFSDAVSDGDLFLGDFKKIVGNLSEAINVSSSLESGFAYNAIDYRGTAIFDCDVALGEAFVKGAATL